MWGVWTLTCTKAALFVVLLESFEGSASGPRDINRLMVSNTLRRLIVYYIVFVANGNQDSNEIKSVVYSQ